MSEYQDFNTALDLTLDQGVSHGEYTERQRGRKRKVDDMDEFDPDNERKRLLANTQERARMHKINHALEDLRKCLPQQFQIYHRRMSKIRTLRLAMNYINSLSEIIREDDIRKQHKDAFALKHPTATHAYNMPTTLVPYYPYQPGACHNYSAIESMYRTPDQPQHQSVFSPRQLNFNVISHTDSTPTFPTEMISVSEITPVKQMSTKRLFHKEGIVNTPEAAHGSLKNEVTVSPFLGVRNQLELNSSFMSSASDSHREDYLEPGQIPGRRSNPCHTLVDIIDGDD